MDSLRFSNEIHDILERRVFAVAGASRDREKFGYKVYRALKNASYTVCPVNPNAGEIDGDTVYPLLDNVPEKIDCVVTVTQPAITWQIVQDAGRLGIPYIWMQPGSESESAVIEARAQGIVVVYGGPCIMVESARRRSEAGTR